MNATRLSLFALLIAQLPALADETKTLQEITVTASSDALEERQASVTQKTIVDRAEIEALGGLTVTEVIRKLPGIDAGAHSGDGGPAANARGMGRDAVQFLVDGERPSANARYALTAVGRLPSGELERIEILRGASAEHGGAAAITVNLIMKKARPSTASTSLRVAAGTRGDEANGQFSASLGGGDKAFSWTLPLSINHHGMPSDKKTIRQASTAGTRTAWESELERGAYTLNEFILSPRLTWRDDAGTLTLWPSLYHNRGERSSRVDRLAYADPVAGSGLTDDGGRRDREDSAMTLLRLRLEGERKLAFGKLSGRVALLDGQRRTDTDRLWRDALGTTTRADESIRRDENEFSSAVRVDRSIGDGLFSAGLEQSWHRREERQRITGAGALRSEHEASSKQWTTWLQHEAPLGDRLTLTGGLRGEHITLEADGRAQSAGQIAPSLAARVAIAPDLVFRSSLGAGIKAPKIDEISGLTVRATGANSPLEPDRAGNGSLKAERNINWEAALEKRLPGDLGIVGANLYLRRTEDFIERRTQLEGARWVERPYNEGTARHWGLELDAKLKTDAIGWKGAALRSHLTLPKARVHDERLGQTRNARELPRYQFTLGVDQALPAWQMSAGFHLTRHSRTHTDIPGETSTQQRPKTLLDLYLTRRLSQQLNLRLDTQNLLRADTRRFSHFAAAGEDWRLGGFERGQRTLLLSLEGKW
ncbi:TonB-dependent siderophore receptor [Azonexus sp.]|uniref:TonB-dependent receptor plug domain-containing protein n=1 Tax=Azonexus sp. TaxID=1872668 RepID=UPI0027BAD557|nr:TonB-dependent receptor [Azonexus sp.]